MSTFQWWRSWHDAPTDHKWAVVAARSGSKPGIVSAVAWALLDYASQHENRGTVTGFDTETYAVFSGFPENEVIQIIQAMTDKKIIIDGRLANWEKRQPKREDDSYGRVTKFREKKRNVTQSNADNEDVTLRLRVDTDTDTDESRVEGEAATIPPQSQIYSLPPKMVEEKIFCSVTNYPTIPNGEMDAVINAIASISTARGLDANQTIDYLRPFFKEAKKRYPMTTKAFWLTDWAVAGTIPEPNGSKKTIDIWEGLR